VSYRYTHKDKHDWTLTITNITLDIHIYPNYTPTYRNKIDAKN